MSLGLACRRCMKLIILGHKRSHRGVEKFSNRLTNQQMTRIATIALLTLALAASSARASIVLFIDGRSMKVTSFKPIDEEMMRFDLAGGGSLTVPLARIDRIVDDEIVPKEVVAEV